MRILITFTHVSYFVQYFSKEVHRMCILKSILIGRPLLKAVLSMTFHCWGDCDCALAAAVVLGPLAGPDLPMSTCAETVVHTCVQCVFVCLNVLSTLFSYFFNQKTVMMSRHHLCD